MNRIDKEHEAFIKLLENPDYLNSVKKNAPLYRLQLEAQLTKDKAFIDKKLASFLKWTIQMSKKEYYLLPLLNSDGVLTLTNRDFGSMVYFRYCSTLTEVTGRLLKIYKEAIEVVQLHSKIKGSGSKILNEFIKLSRDIQLPLVLYTETENLVKYYEQYNFKNYGQQGDNNEYLMIRIPEPNSKFKFRF